VRRIGFGSMRLVGSVAFGAGEIGDPDQAIRVLRRAIELGVDHIDTAGFYGTSLHAANDLIRAALWPLPDDLVIATKVRPDKGLAEGVTSSGWLRSQVEQNLRQLGLDSLDLVYLRVMDDASLADDFAALCGLRQAGLIRHLGVSGVTEQQLNEALAIAPVVAVQNRFGVGVERDIAILRATAVAGIAFVPFFSIAAEGKHRGPVGKEPDDVLEIANAHGASPSQVRIAWTLQLGSHVLGIPGTGNLEHLAENVAAGEIHLSAEEMARLRQSEADRTRAA
jgi:aryl-alcohol dehydrogenase-like predicted oxidoreductase